MTQHPQILRIATRKSPLALIQAEMVKQALLHHFAELKIELVPMTTAGDKHLGMPLAQVGGKGLFVKELEQALLHKHADFAVHSMKDVPAEFPAGLMLAAICKREDPRDVFVCNKFQSLAELPPGSHIGTASLRRQCQLCHLRSDIKVSNLRGNVNSRLDRLDQGEFDAIILAAAGLDRLGLQNRITAFFDPDQFVPAVGQGAIGIECRAKDLPLRKMLQQLNDPITAQCVDAERAMTHRLQGGCTAPIAGYARIKDGVLKMIGLVGSPNGSVMLREAIHGPEAEARRLGTELADKLLSKGAGEILKNL